MLKSIGAIALLGLLAMTSAIADSSKPVDRPLVKEADVAAPRDAVWWAFSTSAGVRSFLVSDARIELRVGGAYELYFNPAGPAGQRGSEGCRVLSYLPGEMLSFTWNAPPQFEDERWQRTYVVVQFTSRSAGRTHVKLTHAGWKTGGRWDDVHAYFDRAWSGVLRELGQACESGSLLQAFAAREDAQSETPTPRKTYVYYIRPTRAGFLDAPTPAESAAFQGHVTHIRQLMSEGRLIAAGPSFGAPQYASAAAAVRFELAPPGVVIFEAVDEAEARAVLERDPCVSQGVFKGVVFPMSLAYYRY